MGVSRDVLQETLDNSSSRALLAQRAPKLHKGVLEGQVTVGTRRSQHCLLGEVKGKVEEKKVEEEVEVEVEEEEEVLKEQVEDLSEVQSRQGAASST